MSIEENEISVKANGGTELTKRILSKAIPADMLEQVQIVPTRIRELDETKVRIYWANEIAEDPESQKYAVDYNNRAKFHCAVFVSNWLYQRFQMVHRMPWESRNQVIESAIEPITVDEDKFTFDKEVRLVYNSTPNRGLSLLVPVFAKLHEKYGDKIHLDVFSSFNLYGWPEMDEQFKPLYKACEDHPGITYQGFKPHEEVVDWLGTYGHIHAYPCIYPETSCRTVIEAMSAKLLCVHSNYAVLPETTAGQNLMYAGDQDPNVHASIFYNALDQAINTYLVNRDSVLNKLQFNKFLVDNRYGVQKIGEQWASLIKVLLKEFPTPESRKFAKEKFVVRT